MAMDNFGPQTSVYVVIYYAGSVEIATTVGILLQNDINPEGQSARNSALDAAASSIRDAIGVEVDDLMLENSVAIVKISDVIEVPWEEADDE